MKKLTIQVFSSVEKLADFFARRISESITGIAGGRYFYLAISGGSTPKVIFKTIAENYKDKIDWSKVMIFWGDERCVAPSSDESNYKMAYESLLKNINVPESNIYRIKAEKDPAHEIERYTGIVNMLLPRYNNTPQFDLVMLGLGEDGHTASIFPDNIHLFNSEKLFEISQHRVTKQKRITVTGRLINNAKQVCILVTGASKAERVAQILQKKPGWENLPASLVTPENGELVWMLDDMAGQLLIKEAGSFHD
jgi:6-phosphogluconolactonase